MSTATASIEPLRALRALRALLRNPDDLPQVFTIVDALSGGMRERTRRRLARDPVGARLLAEAPDMGAILSDRAALAAMPAGSLAHAYLRFVESEGISAEGIRSADAAGMQESGLPAEHRFIHAWMRDTHDLWHAAVGYQGDVLGEAALLAFSLAQSWNPGVALIVAAALAKGWSSHVPRTIWDGFRRGRRAAWLPGQDWRTLLPLPLEEVRRRLRLDGPPDYVPVRSSELRANGKIAA